MLKAIRGEYGIDGTRIRYVPYRNTNIATIKKKKKKHGLQRNFGGRNE
jgi:hypothetical protein